jgi:TNF receptor-associated factor 5
MPPITGIQSPSILGHPPESTVAYPPVYIVQSYSSDEGPPDLDGEQRSSPSPSAGEFLNTQGRSSRKTTSLNLVHTIQLRALTYVDTVDENLMCSICRCPLVDPITTSCDHTFCFECIEESLLHNSTCPIDRSPLDSKATLQGQTPKIIRNQLDSLRAKCPCCDAAIARSMLENHMEKYCPDSMMRCPGKNTEVGCEHLIKRKLSNKGCLHYYTDCPDCHESLFRVDLDEHRETTCAKRMGNCTECGVDILRCKRSEHEDECPDVVAPCRWTCYGCRHQAKRKDLHLHADECSFRFVGPLAEMLKKEIGDLRSEVRTLTETNQHQERRIKFLEKGERATRDFGRPLDYADISNQALASLPEPSNAEPLSSGHEYLLSLLEAQESNLSRLSASMTELEAKQTTMLFNETIPIKNELAEIRSMQQTTSMHVRWLMRFRIQENNRRYAPGPGPSGGGSEGGGGSSGDSVLPRRLSDSMGSGLVTKL